jgi:hypothetical protein
MTGLFERHDPARIGGPPTDEIPKSELFWLPGCSPVVYSAEGAGEPARRLLPIPFDIMCEPRRRYLRYALETRLYLA